MTIPRKLVPEPDDPEESKRFIDTAREVEACEDTKDFERAFKKVVHPDRKERARDQSWRGHLQFD
jgi:hypothetical protein